LSALTYSQNPLILDAVFTKTYTGLIFVDDVTNSKPLGKLFIDIGSANKSFYVKNGILIFDSGPPLDITIKISSNYYLEKEIIIKNDFYSDELGETKGKFNDKNRISEPIKLIPKSNYPFSSSSTLIRGQIKPEKDSIFKISITGTKILSFIKFENEFVLFIDDDASEQLMNFTTSFMNGESNNLITLNVEKYTIKNNAYELQNSFKTKKFQLIEFSTLNVGTISMGEITDA